MTRRFNVVVTRPIPEAGLALLRETCDIWSNPEDRRLDRGELLARIKEADGVIGVPTDRIDAAFFDAAPALVGYANYAVGYDNIDVAEATRRRLPVSNTPDVLTVATAEMAWALLFAVARHILPSDAHTRSGTWVGLGTSQFLGQEITGKTLGIFGPGRIGTAMAPDVPGLFHAGGLLRQPAPPTKPWNGSWVPGACPSTPSWPEATSSASMRR